MVTLYPPQAASAECSLRLQEPGMGREQHMGQRAPGASQLHQQHPQHTWALRQPPTGFVSQLNSPKTRYFLNSPPRVMRLKRLTSRDRGCSRQDSGVNFHPTNYLSNKAAFWAPPMGSFCQQQHWYLHFQGHWARCQWRSGWGRSAPPQR